MANIEVTLQRYSGVGVTDTLFPSTTLNQIVLSIEDSTPLSTYLSDTYIPLTQKGAANGVATLGADSKIPDSQLPVYIFGGQKFSGLVNLSAGTEGTPLDLGTVLTSNANFSNMPNESLLTTYQKYIGYYLEVTHTGWINNFYSWSGAEGSGQVSLQGFDDGAAIGSPIKLEAGDWFVVSEWDGVNNILIMRSVNMSYDDATTAVKGVVQLSNITTLTGATGNNVITNGVLAGLIGTTTGSIAAGDHLHDSRYYTETEIQNWITGSAAISSVTNIPLMYGTNPVPTYVGTIMFSIDS